MEIALLIGRKLSATPRRSGHVTKKVQVEGEARTIRSDNAENLYSKHLLFKISALTWWTLGFNMLVDEEMLSGFFMHSDSWSTNMLSSCYLHRTEVSISNGTNNELKLKSFGFEITFSGKAIYWHGKTYNPRPYPAFTLVFFYFLLIRDRILASRFATTNYFT